MGHGIVSLAGAAFIVSATAAFASPHDLPEWQARAFFPHAAKNHGEWEIDRAELDPKFRDLPPAAHDRPYLQFGSTASWNRGKESLTLLLADLTLNTDCDGGSYSFLVGIFSGHKLVARSRELFSYGSGAEAATGGIGNIDTARYQISETERAFAVRNKHSSPHRYQCYADQTLDLFRVVGDDVVRILHTDVAYEQIVYEPDNEAGDRDPECRVSPKDGTFRMLPTKTKGFFDIERSQKGAGKLVYHWTGSAYEPATPDPTNHSVRDDWDWCTGRLELERRGKK